MYIKLEAFLYSCVTFASSETLLICSGKRMKNFISYFETEKTHNVVSPRKGLISSIEKEVKCIVLIYVNGRNIFKMFIRERLTLA